MNWTINPPVYWKKKLVNRNYILSGGIVCNDSNRIWFIVMNRIRDFIGKHAISTLMLSNKIIVNIKFCYSAHTFKLDKCASFFSRRINIKSLGINSLPFKEIPIFLHVYA